jgi:hypothetical protein
MEDLIELVAASFARHGIECPASDSQLVSGRAPSQGPPAACSHSDSESAIGQAVRPAEPALTAALPDHNYRKGSQTDPTP